MSGPKNKKGALYSVIDKLKSEPKVKEREEDGRWVFKESAGEIDQLSVWSAEDTDSMLRKGTLVVPEIPVQIGDVVDVFALGRGFIRMAINYVDQWDETNQTYMQGTRLNVYSAQEPRTYEPGE